MRSIIFFLLAFSSLCAKNFDSFITKGEYAQMLYYNPRGIGCHLCHGERGEGKIIATYSNKGQKKTLAAPPIDSVDYLAFREALNSQHKVMPKYFLTDEEIGALFYYVTSMTQKK